MPDNTGFSYNDFEELDFSDPSLNSGYSSFEESSTYSQTVSRPIVANIEVSESISKQESKPVGSRNNVPTPIPDQPVQNRESVQSVASNGQIFVLPSEKGRKKENGRKKRYVIGIVVVALLVIGIAVAAYMHIKNADDDRADSAIEASHPDGSDVASTLPTESDYITGLPKFGSMFGSTSEEVGTILGENYQVSATEDIEGSDVVRRVTFMYSPVNASSLKLKNAPTVKVSLDSDGKVIGVYFMSSMSLLGYPDSDFPTLIATSDTLTSILQAAGIDYDPFNYTAPSASDYTTYVDPDAENPVVSKESVKFIGTISGNATPKTWSIALTYSYSEASNDADAQPERLVEIELS